MIVVLKTPSLAQRVAAAGGVVGTSKERAWTTTALTAQKLLVSRLALSGVSVHPDYSFARVLNGFSAVLDPSAIPLLERDDDVAGVYPVRVAYPATISTRRALPRRLRAGLGPSPRDRHLGRRRTRRDDRAARHRASTPRFRTSAAASSTAST